MKSNRNLTRGDGRRLGNAALIAFMLGSLLVLSLVRARFSPIGMLRSSSSAQLDCLSHPAGHGGLVCFLVLRLPVI